MNKSIDSPTNESLPVPFRIVIGLLLLIQGYFAGTMFMEYINVAVQGNTEDYNFGSREISGWIYQSSTLYTTTTLIGSIFYILLIITTLISAWIRNEVVFLVLILLTCMVILITLYVGFFPWVSDPTMV